MANSEGALSQPSLLRDTWLGRTFYVGFFSPSALQVVTSLLGFAIVAEKCTSSFEDALSVLPVFPLSFVHCSFMLI